METASAQVGIQVSQQGNELTFFFDGCNVRANATGEDTFALSGFDCERRVNQQTWRLRGARGSRITASATAFDMVITGDAESGDEDRSFTWSFTGRR